MAKDQLAAQQSVLSITLLIVGTVLNPINQGDALLGMASINWMKLIFTYCVPYAVCTYGAVSYQLKKANVTFERRV